MTEIPLISYNSGNIVLASATGAKIYKMPMVSYFEKLNMCLLAIY